MVDGDGDRIDLTPLGGPDSLQAESVVGGAMRRIRAAPEREPLVEALAAWWRPGLIAALLVFALGVLLARRSSVTEPGTAAVEARMMDWALGGHIPSNGELLVTFRGYWP